jgi:hypothetical protein
MDARIALGLKKLGDLLLGEILGTSTGNATTRRGSPSAAARSAISAKIVSGVSRRTGFPQPRQKRRAVRAKSSFK